MIKNKRKLFSIYILIKYLLLITVVLILHACSGYNNLLTHRYIFTSDENQIDEYHSEITEVTNVDNQGFVNTQTISDVKRLNKVIYIPRSISQNSIKFSEIINLLERGKNNKVSKIIEGIDTTDSNYNFLKGVNFFYKSDYQSASNFFKKNKNPKLSIMSEIMIVDCTYHILKNNMVKIDKTLFLEYYQDIVDKYELDENYIKLINNRIKLIRL